MDLKSEKISVDNMMIHNLKLRGKSKTYISVASTTMKSFWNYALQSAIHGYPVEIKNFGTLTFCFDTILNYSRFKGQKFFSEKTADYFFFFNLDIPKLENYKYKLVVNRSTKRMIENFLNNDHALKMIKDEKSFN